MHALLAQLKLELAILIPPQLILLIGVTDGIQQDLNIMDEMDVYGSICSNITSWVIRKAISRQSIFIYWFKIVIAPSIQSM